jgi:hypothetical protein
MCSTQTASGSAVDPSTWYLPSSPAPSSSSIYCLPAGDREVWRESQGRGGDWLTRAFCHFSPCLSPPLSLRVSASPQDRMVLLVMGNIINWSL